MAERDMSYELDGIFSTRNQGQLISSSPVATQVTRTPGLTPMRVRPTARAIPGSVSGMGEYVEAPNYSGGSMVDQVLKGLGAEINLPIIGSVSVGMGLLAGLGVYFLLKEKK